MGNFDELDGDILGGPGLELAKPTREEEAAAAPSTPSLDEEEKITLEATQLAAFGDAPKSVFSAVFYALHVWQRKRALANELDEAKRLEALAETDVQTSLADLGTRVYAALGGKRPPALAPIMNTVEVARKSLDRRDANRSQARETADLYKRKLEEDLAETRARVTPLRARELRLADDLAAKEQVLTTQREGLRIRKEELASLDKSDTERTTSQRHIDDLRMVTNEIQQRRESLVIDVGNRELTTKMSLDVATETRDAYEKAKRELKEADETVADLEKRSTESQTLSGEAVQVHERSFDEAKRDLDRALRELAEAALKSGEAKTDQHAMAVRSLAHARETRAARKRTAVIHERAPQLYDQSAYKKGLIVLGMLSGVSLLALLLFLFR